MKKVFALLIIVLLVFGLTASVVCALPADGDPEGNGWMKVHQNQYGQGHPKHNCGGNRPEEPPHAFGHGVPEFPLVALPGIVGFAGLALVWLKRFFYR